jgi:excisionase family DNA binding protein
MDTKNLYRGSDIARILGISRSLAYRLLATGAIPSVRFGRIVRCRAEDLEGFIMKNLTSKDSTFAIYSGSDKESV